jgi:hypothetical protein
MTFSLKHLFLRDGKNHPFKGFIAQAKRPTAVDKGNDAAIQELVNAIKS